MQQKLVTLPCDFWYKGKNTKIYVRKYFWEYGDKQSEYKDEFVSSIELAA